jgi:hypothetical protein
MSKTKATQETENAGGKPAVIDTPKNGTTILTGKTRDEVAQKFEELKASCEGATLMAGAVGRKADGSAYTLQVDIVKQ